MATPLLARPASGSELKAVPITDRPGALEVLSMRRDPFAFAAEKQRRYGEVYGINAFGVRMVMACGAEAAAEILQHGGHDFANAPAWSYFIGPFFHRGVMLLDFGEHRHHRRIMQEAFTQTALRGYFAEMQPMIADRVARITPGRARMLTEFKHLTLDVALEVFLGLELPDDEAERINRAFIDTVRAGVSVIRKPVPGGRWWKGVRSRKVLEQFFAEHLPAKRARQTPDLFSVLCHAETDDGHRFTDEDVVNHMIFVLMAAHDTSTITMTQMAYWMARYPSWQERARDEALTCGGDLAYDDVKGLTTLDAIMKESLRLCPPVPAQPRVAVRDTAVRGHFIPEGTMVVIPQLANHRDPRYFSHPGMFDPERFAPGRAEDKRHRLAWMPFGAGVHKCIGMHFAQQEIAVAMHHLLRNFAWSVPAGYDMPMDYSALPVPKDQLPVTLERR